MKLMDVGDAGLTSMFVGAWRSGVWLEAPGHVAAWRAPCPKVDQTPRMEVWWGSEMSPCKDARLASSSPGLFLKAHCRVRGQRPGLSTAWAQAWTGALCPPPTVLDWQASRPEAHASQT